MFEWILQVLFAVVALLILAQLVFRCLRHLRNKWNASRSSPVEHQFQSQPALDSALQRSRVRQALVNEELVHRRRQRDGEAAANSLERREREFRRFTSFENASNSQRLDDKRTITTDKSGPIKMRPLATEPDMNALRQLNDTSETAVKVAFLLFRCPDGSKRYSRLFNADDTAQTVLDFLYNIGYSDDSFTAILSFPSRVALHENRQRSLEELNLTSAVRPDGKITGILLSIEHLD